MDKLQTRPESFRLGRKETAWIDRWVQESGQDRTGVLRAAVRLLIELVDNLRFGDRVRMLAQLSQQSFKGLSEEQLDQLRSSIEMVARSLEGQEKDGEDGDGRNLSSLRGEDARRPRKKGG